jgi:hypothetical protein
MVPAKMADDPVEAETGPALNSVAFAPNSGPSCAVFPMLVSVKRGSRALSR